MSTWRNRGASGGLAGASSKFESRPQKRKPPPRRQLGAVCDRRSQFHPAMMVKVLVYGYATGVFSSCKIERRLHEDLA